VSPKPGRFRRCVVALYAVFATACLLLSIVVLALCLRSYSRIDAFYVADRDYTWTGGQHEGYAWRWYAAAESARGRLHLNLLRSIEPGPRDESILLTEPLGEPRAGHLTRAAGSPEPGDDEGPWAYRSLRILRAPDAPRQITVMARVPHWAASLALALPAAAWAARQRARRRRLARLRAGTHCQACGYDLRATPDRCPECGRAVPMKT
jgi:hypothetical protein